MKEIIISKKDKSQISVTVDDDDFDRISKYKWNYHPRGLITSLKRKDDYILMHRLICDNGGKRVYFLNQNKFDCRKKNLSIDNSYLSRRRKILIEKPNGKIEGVYFNPLRNSYTAHIKFNNIQISKTFSLFKYDDINTAKELAIEQRKNFISLPSEKLKQLFRINKKLPPGPKTFEECYDSIRETIYKRKNKWFLNKYSYIDFDDIAIEILNHINNKWHLWDQQRNNLKSWVNTIVSNQILNKARNYNNKNGYREGIIVTRESDVIAENNDYLLNNNSEIIAEEKEPDSDRMDFLNNEIKNKLNKTEYKVYLDKILPTMIKLLENYKK